MGDFVTSSLRTSQGEKHFQTAFYSFTGFTLKSNQH